MTANEHQIHNLVAQAGLSSEKNAVKECYMITNILPDMKNHERKQASNSRTQKDGTP